MTTILSIKGKRENRLIIQIKVIGIFEKILTVARSDERLRRFSVHRWNDIAQGNLDYQHMKLELPAAISDLHLQIVQGSTKAFLVLGHHNRILNEIDMRDFPVNASTEIQFDSTMDETERILHHQVSSDGYYLGFVFCVYDELVSSKEKLFVQVTDLSPLKNSTKSIELCGYVADEITKAKGESVDFSADLSILRVGNWVFDLNSAPDDVTAAQFSESESNYERRAVFSPCNRFICLIDDGHKFKIYELRRSTKALIELSVQGAQFSSGLRCAGKFHPHLPILLLGGAPLDQTGWINKCEVIEIDLSSLKALKLPSPHLVWSSTANEFIHYFRIEFSDRGRLAWFCCTPFRDRSNESWCKVPKSYSLEVPKIYSLEVQKGYPLKVPKSYSLQDEKSIKQMPFVWQQSMMHDQKIYGLTNMNQDFVALKLRHRMGDRWGETPQAHVRVTPIPYSMRGHEVYLLPGHKEEDLVRVLFVSNSKRATILKVLPITMKKILAKLDDVAETLRTQQQVEDASSESQSRDGEATDSE